VIKAHALNTVVIFYFIRFDNSVTVHIINMEVHYTQTQYYITNYTERSRSVSRYVLESQMDGNLIYWLNRPKKSKGLMGDGSLKR
jgi:hypothetical protein